MTQEVEEPDDNGWVVFDRSITTTGPLANIFRIFTEGQVTKNLPDMCLDDTFAAEEIVVTDGSCFNNGQDDAAAGAGVFYEEGDDRKEAIKLPEVLEQSNQTAEMVAMKEVVRKAGDMHLKIESDSKYTLDAVTKNRKKWEDQGYIGVSNKKLNKTTVAALWQRKQETKLRWVK
jgi:ribonuclease HI